MAQVGKAKGLLAGAAIVAGTVAVAEAAQAASYSGGPWTNNGCQYRANAGDQPDPWGATGEVWRYGESGTCSAGWVEVHATDSKGANQVVSGRSDWTSGSEATFVTAGAGTTLRYACFSARSTKGGNWSTVRKLGTGSGACGHP